jgi:hypothetical protein
VQVIFAAEAEPAKTTAAIAAVATTLKIIVRSSQPTSVMLATNNVWSI